MTNVTQLPPATAETWPWRQSDRGNWSVRQGRHQFTVWRDKRGQWGVCAAGVFVPDRWPSAEQAKAAAERADLAKLDRLEALAREALRLG